jgi:hypothetical protein
MRSPFSNGALVSGALRDIPGAALRSPLTGLTRYRSSTPGVERSK